MAEHQRRWTDARLCGERVGRTFDDSRIVMQPVGGGAARTLIENAIAPRLDGEGRLFYLDRESTLTVSRFGTNGIADEPQRLRNRVLDLSGNGVFDVSRTGLAAFARGIDYRRRRVTVVSADGTDLARSDEQPSSQWQRRRPPTASPPSCLAGAY